MTPAETTLVTLVPLSGLLASISLVVLTSSSYGAKLSFGLRLLIWAIAFSFASTAVRGFITMLAFNVVPVIDGPYTVLVMVTNVAAKIMVMSSVVGLLWHHDRSEYAKSGCSAFWKDLSITSLQHKVPAAQSSSEVANV